MDTYMRVGFKDSAERISEVRYRLFEGIEADGSNMASVISNAQNAQLALAGLTWDEITHVIIEVDVAGASSAPNAAANNQVWAAIKCLDNETNAPAQIDLPAWDDALYDQDSNHIITSPAFGLTVGDLLMYIANPDTGNYMSFFGAMSRARKSRGKQLV